MIIRNNIHVTVYVTIVEKCMTHVTSHGLNVKTVIDFFEDSNVMTSTRARQLKEMLRVNRSTDAGNAGKRSTRSWTKTTSVDKSTVLCVRISLKKAIVAT